MRYVEPDFGVLSISEKRKITHLREDLLGWFSRYGRNLPWRSARASEFEQICVEVLLQRTRAETVAAMYPAFFAQYKTWSDLADASIRELEENLKPIGLWRRRAISIKGLATYAAGHDGRFPTVPRELGEVPGVGQYVMNAILLFQHGAVARQPVCPCATTTLAGSWPMGWRRLRCLVQIAPSVWLSLLVVCGTLSCASLLAAAVR